MTDHSLLLGNDLVINENSCNLSCQYCLTGQSNLKKSHEEQLIFRPPTRDTYTSTTPLGERLNTIIDNVAYSFKTPLLKITGGELFLVRNIMDFITRCASQYEMIIIQTNGVLIKPDQIETLLKFKNIVIQISLDSHLYNGNSFRVQSESLHNKIVERIKNIITSGLETEIYSVINKKSIIDIEVFSEWLLQLNKKTIFFPFPIRGPDANQFKPTSEQIIFIENFIKRYNEFSAILPPKAYFDRLLSFYKNGKRTFRCHLPRLVFSTFSDGMLTACPNIWFSELGNVLNENSWNEAKEKIGESGLYKALLAPKPRLDACMNCYTPWDLLSMYFDDEITLDELCSSPVYAPSKIRKLLFEKKQEYISER